MDLRDRLGPSLAGSAVRTERVLVPPAHEGLGNALRSAFLPRASDMPHDSMRLLDRLH